VSEAPEGDHSPRPSIDDLVATREALHAVAEQVLAAALHRVTGRIGLRAAPGGFTTPWFPLDGDRQQRVRIDGTDIVVETIGGGEEDLLRAPLSTLRAAAHLAGIEPGAPAEVYAPATTLAPDAPLAVDRRAAAELATFYAVADDALARFASELPSPVPVVQLWPEHFDLGISAEDVNYGASPGDAGHDEPYFYAGPWSSERRQGAFWNESFGVSRSWRELGDATSAVELFREARSHALGAGSD
jgi:hypothetical protein